MWTPFCDGSRSTVQSIVAAISFSLRAAADAHRLLDAGHAGARQPEPDLRRRGLEIVERAVRRLRDTARLVPAVQNDTSFARLVSLACHDVRTPLATVHGFAATLSRTMELDPPADRYVEMIEAASTQIAELLDELSLAARIEGGRYDPREREADTLALAQAAAERLGADRVHVSGEGDARADRRRGGRPRRLRARAGDAPARRPRRGRRRRARRRRSTSRR